MNDSVTTKQKHDNNGILVTVEGSALSADQKAKPFDSNRLPEKVSICISAPDNPMLSL